MARKRDSGLTEEQAQHLAAKLKPFYERDFDSNQTRMAKAWKLSQPQLGQILNAKGRGAGVAVLCRLREATGITIDELLGLEPIGPSVNDRIKSAVAEQLTPDRIRDALSNWLEAVPEPPPSQRSSSLPLPPGRPARARLPR